MTTSEAPDDTPLERVPILSPGIVPARVIILGASNVAWARNHLVRRIRQLLGTPLEFYFVAGHGRSYGIRTTVLWGQTLPGISSCGLWSVLDERLDHTTPSYALITDIGNDLLYGQAVEDISTWVEACVDRLLRLGTRVVVTGLPMENLSSLGPIRFQVMRTLIFRDRFHRLTEIKEQAASLDRSLRRLADAHRLTLVPLRGSWYGFDPIHLRRSSWQEAWDEMVAAWLAEPNNRDVDVSAEATDRWPSLRFRVPAERWLFGRRQSTPQPTLTLADGSKVFLY
ncbi:MAG: hypothetical protein JSV66_17385 [Trueperaceae bacterium]|nr:MAG: hypothetical protein JSV66_17385 [Trueperaceae bacterium]